jgi:hypothetical protein
MEREKQAQDAPHDRRDGHQVDRLVDRMAVAFAIVGKQAVDLSVGACQGGGHGIQCCLLAFLDAA